MNPQDAISQSGIIETPQAQNGQALKAATLNDLAVNETLAAEVKGGIVGGTSAAAGEFPYIVSFQNTTAGSGAALHLTPTNELSSNHNETVAADDANRTDLLADLPVADEQADAVCGGEEQIDRPRPPSGTGFVNNHNETASHDEEDSVAFTELSLTDEELDGIKGGPLCHGVSALAWARVDGVSPLSNHNETFAENEASAESLADLRVQADEQIKGGPNQVGTGVLTLNGANTYLGTTSIPSQGAGSGGGAGKVHVHDISISK